MIWKKTMKAMLVNGYWILAARSNMAPFLTQFLEKRKNKILAATAYPCDAEFDGS